MTNLSCLSFSDYELVGKINKIGIALVHDTDFINYGMLDGLLHVVPGTGMWECVDFSGLETSIDGPGVKHVAKASFDDNMHDSYAIGTYNDKNGAWIPESGPTQIDVVSD
ncbi:hypothetical protein GQ457_16G026510 [Hibiscus cannabinus]